MFSATKIHLWLFCSGTDNIYCVDMGISEDEKDSLPVSVNEESKDIEDGVPTTRRLAENQPLMDWQKGLVGWESESDTANPLPVAHKFL
jgi:hypothetical protein